MGLSLAIIAKDEVHHLERIIYEYQEYFDEIVIGYDDKSCAMVGEGNPKVKTYQYEWSDKEKELGYIFFDRKRNWLKEQVTGDYYLRLDTDDRIINPEVIRAVYEKAKAHKVQVVHVWYQYDPDFGHNRETLIQKTDKIYWKKRVHENIVPVDGFDYKVVIEKGFSLEHLPRPSHVDKSSSRNFQYLLDEYKEDGDNTDPRTIAYLGRMLFEFGEYDKAIYFLEKHIQASGWDEDRYVSWCYLSDVYRAKGDFKNAVSCAFEALAERPTYPDAYFRLHYTYFQQQKWKEAIHWGEIGLKMPEPTTFTVIDKAAHTWKPYITLAQAYLMENDAATAKMFFNKAKELVPNLEWVIQNEKVFEDAIEHQKYLRDFAGVLRVTQAKEPDKLIHLANSIPKELLKDEKLQQFRLQVTPIKTWDSKSVVFFCPTDLEDWAAPNVIQGIGGSEEAVIYLSQELVKLGYEVTVFNQCGDLAGKYSGVEYKPLHDFNPMDNFNILVGWRCNIFDVAKKAKRKLMWLHDVPTGWQFDNNTFDKVIVLSEYHKSLLPKEVPEEKIIVSSNGINLADFNCKEERNPYRMIYTSSYDRGIEHLLRMWSEVKKEVPQAELHLFYGWNTYDAFMKRGYRDGKAKEAMMELMKQDGVFEHGRVGHKKLAKELSKSKFWVYPSHFEEISCISAMKAQAAGCIPVCTDYAALAETVKDGVIVHGKCGDGTVNANYKNKLIAALKEPPTINIDKEQFGWNKVAKQWSEKVFA